ncbi:glycine zipper 2TM domain-containing protein [Novosphingobium sp. KCTC 2891]|uniref:glycine zipper 2TM domain-containing protein n=1 Tax=Novosphingobium sp. KCTC 2891 TaxID=2989730 RepID=UPI0022232AC3|nr:glycine zipper 2TM domain-containing protein [Novosphingobium sp. KCTC 2891]MCW1382591.1 glycine zipper 2TM domain-containing protein [Novosphingobium sp. KCTC 2891]
MKTIKTAAMALAAAGTLAGMATPVLAADFHAPSANTVQLEQSWNHGDRYRGYDGYRGDYNGYRGDYGRGDYGRGDDDRRYYRGNDNRRDYYRGASWRGRDGRTYCRRSDGTTGLLIGGAAGALLGREVAGYNGDRTLGAILGAAGGALLGREVDRGGSRCR